MQIRKVKVFLIGLLLLLHGCTYDKEELLYPPGNCNSAGSTYSITVNPIIANHCVSCHGNTVATSNGSGIILDNYNSIKPYASNGKLIGVINHASGYPKMPKNAAKLSTCDIAKITDWVSSGALNN